MKLNHLIPLVCLSTAAYAAPQTFDFKDPKGVNNAVFISSTRRWNPSTAAPAASAAP
jgi:hypothetical protein